MDRVKDDGANMNNAYDAVSFLQGGGFQTKDRSHGESSLIYIDTFLTKIKSKIVPENAIGFDEVDAGLRSLIRKQRLSTWFRTWHIRIFVM